MDWIGTAAIMSMTILVLLSLDFGGVVFPWDSSKILSILGSGLVLLAVFAIWESKGAADPLIPVRLLNSISKASMLVVCAAHSIVMHPSHLNEENSRIANFIQVNVASWYFLPLYFQAVRGASPVRSGVLLMPVVVVQALVGVGVGGIIYHYGCLRPIIWTGMCLTTLGFGLFITMGVTTSLSSLVAIEVVTAMGVGAVFQAPLIAYQAAVDAADMAKATALFGFVRSLSTSISVVVGGVVFQNTFREHGSELSTVLGNTSLAQEFSAANATSSVLVVQTLTLVQQHVVRDVFVASLRSIWTMYAGIGGFGLILALFIQQRSLRGPTRESRDEGDTRRPSGAGNSIELTR